MREGLATQLARLEQRQRQLIADAESRFTGRDRAARRRHGGQPGGTDPGPRRTSAPDQGGDRRGDERARDPCGRAAPRAARGRRPPADARALPDRADRPRAHRVAAQADRDLHRRRAPVGRAGRALDRAARRPAWPRRRRSNSGRRSGRRGRRRAASSPASSTGRSRHSRGRQSACSAERLAEFNDTGGGRLERRGTRSEHSTSLELHRLAALEGVTT